jgi:hypothetical protein
VLSGKVAQSHLNCAAVVEPSGKFFKLYALHASPCPNDVRR